VLLRIGRERTWGAPTPSSGARSPCQISAGISSVLPACRPTFSGKMLGYGSPSLIMPGQGVRMTESASICQSEGRHGSARVLMSRHISVGAIAVFWGSGGNLTPSHGPLPVLAGSE
jgi:hypothetical protein